MSESLTRVHLGELDVLDPITGEVVDCSSSDLAAVYVENLRQTKGLIDKAVKEASGHLLAAMRREGKSKLQLEHVVATKKVTRKYERDLDEMESELREAGLGEERMAELFVETVERKIDAGVARQVGNNNEDYKAIIDRHTRLVSETESVETKPR